MAGEFLESVTMILSCDLKISVLEKYNESPRKLCLNNHT